jgi:hypothetical protein
MYTNCLAIIKIWLIGVKHRERGEKVSKETAMAYPGGQPALLLYRGVLTQLKQRHTIILSILANLAN